MAVRSFLGGSTDLYRDGLHRGARGQASIAVRPIALSCSRDAPSWARTDIAHKRWAFPVQAAPDVVEERSSPRTPEPGGRMASA